MPRCERAYLQLHQHVSPLQSRQDDLHRQTRSCHHSREPLRLPISKYAHQDQYFLHIIGIHVHGIANNEGLNSHSLRCPNNPTCNLSSICHQDLRKAKHLLPVKLIVFRIATIMEFVKRVFGFHKTPPVLVECCLFELNCIMNNVIPPKGRRACVSTAPSLLVE